MSELLRLATAGSVDDGKSTLIGRLLFDTKQVMQDTYDHIVETSERRGDGYVNLALLTDGLRAEREQGITIDVAYRYFATPRRTFVLADTPGHEQYTRNMVTGASTADLAIVLVDARHGVVEQSRRHAYIASLLRIPHLVLAVNKMDLVDYDQARFEEIVEDFNGWAGRLGLEDVVAIPMSALHGDNVVDPSDEMDWYDGPPLLRHLEGVEIFSVGNLNENARFPVQWVIRPMSEEHHDYRGYAGQVAGGIFRPGDDVVVLPSGRTTRVAAIETSDGPLLEAEPPLSVTIRLEDDLDVSRGDVICGVARAPEPVRELEAMVCWMDEAPLRPGGKYFIKHTTRTCRAIVDELEHRVEVNTLDEDAVDELRLNDVGRVRLRLSEPLVADPYAVNRATGAFILIDERTNFTAGAGMVL